MLLCSEEIKHTCFLCANLGVVWLKINTIHFIFITENASMCKNNAGLKLKSLLLNRHSNSETVLATVCML